MSEREFLEPVFIDAFDLDDAWFRTISAILEKGYVYTITRGSYQGQRRLEFDFATIRVRKPSHQIIPIIPEGMSIPAPTDMEYIQGYLGYLLTGTKTESEDYTYGERLVEPKVKISQNINGKDMVQEMPLEVNQVEEVIRIYKEKGQGTNQAIMEIGMPSDIKLVDPIMHKKYCGESNEIILHNLKLLDEMGVPFVIRVPLIPGVTDTDKNLLEIAKLISKFSSNPPIDLLSYNRAAGGKYQACGLKFKPGFNENKKVNLNIEVFKQFGLKARLYL